MGPVFLKLSRCVGRLVLDWRPWDRGGGWGGAGGALGKRSETVPVGVTARWGRGGAVGLGTGSETVVTAGGTPRWERVGGV